MAARGGRGGSSGGGNASGGRGRGAQWRQVSGRASPAPASTPSPTGGQGQQRPARAGSQSSGAGAGGGANGAGNGVQAGEAQGSDLLAKLRQHTGQRVTLSLRAGPRLTGRLTGVSEPRPGAAAGGGTPSTLVSLEDVVETQRKGGVETTGGSMPQLSVGLGQIVAVEPAPAPAPASAKSAHSQSQSFRTDKDIANGRAPRERELQPWQPDADSGPSGSATALGGGGLGAGSSSAARRDQETFGDLSAGPASSQGWDQFATNEKLFGARTDFDENLYTTRVNRDKAGFKAREQEAERLAREIMNSDTSNPHIAEERGRDVTGMDEEDKFSGVQRSANAYVPPGARKGGPSIVTPAQGKASADAAQAPAAKASEPTPSAPPPAENAAESSTSKLSPAATKAGEADRAATAANLPSARKTDKPETPVIRHDVQVQIREFVGTERERLDKKKIAMQRIERERNLSELKKFGKDFQVKLPFPEELLPIIASTPEKQRAIQEKLKAQSNGSAAEGGSSGAVASPSTPSASSKTAPRTPARMQIQEIPPFGGRKPPAIDIPATAGQSVPKVPADASQGAEQSRQAAAAGAPKLNPGASSFVFKPNAAAAQFTPGNAAKSPEAPAAPGLPVPSAAGPAIPSPSQAGKALASPRAQAKLPETRAPDAVASFFPPTTVKRITNVNVRDDFNPFKLKVPDPKSVSPAWPFTGKRLAIQPLPGMTAVFGAATNANEEDSGMFANGQALQGLALSPSPAPNFPYPPGTMPPMRYPMQMGPHGAMPPMAMPPGPGAAYPPFAGNGAYMGGPMYPNPNMPAFMNPAQGGPPGSAMGGMRPAAPMMYQGQPPTSPHPGSPYAGQVSQVSPAPQ